MNSPTGSDAKVEKALDAALERFQEYIEQHPWHAEQAIAALVARFAVETAAIE